MFELPHRSTRIRLHRLVVASLLSLSMAMPIALSRPTPVAAVGSWEQVAVVGERPPARWDHTLSADEEANALILFGGRDNGGAAFGDTWLFDVERSTWSPVESDGPVPRFGHAVSVNQKARQLYLFGGQQGDLFFNDTWRLDLASLEWTEVRTDEDSRPSPRYGTSAVLVGDGRLIVSHGFTFDGRFDDTWALDLETGTWSDISPEADGLRPLRRCLHEAVWDAGSGRMLLFGGCASGFGPCPLGDLWAFDPEAREWTQLTDGGPAPRSNPAMVVDERKGRVLVLGGLAADGFVSDLWAVPLGDEAGVDWVALAPEDAAPSPRASLDATVSKRQLYVFGGFGNDGVLNDLWTLNLRRV